MARSPTNSPREIRTRSAVRTRLTRSRTNRIIFSVYGEIGQYFDIDAPWVRVLGAVAAFFSAVFPGFTRYFILAFVIYGDDAPTS